MNELTNRQVAMLAMEQRWWEFAGGKEQEIRDQFGCSASRYYTELNALLDEPAAVAHDPLLVAEAAAVEGGAAAARSARGMGGVSL